MTPETYRALPADVAAGLPSERVRLDGSMPHGQVDITSQGGITRMPVTAFVRARRKARKAERRNRKASRR